MGKKADEFRGFIRGLNFSARLTDVVQIEMLRKIRAERSYKAMGFSTWEEFCTEVVGYSPDTVERRIKAIEELGSELTKILLSAKLSWSDIRLIPRMLDEAQREKLKKQKVIEVDDRKIEVTEDNADAVVSTVQMLLERQKRMEKETERLQRKLRALEQEEKKMEKAYQERIRELELQLPDNRPDIEWSVKYIKELHDQVARFCSSLGRFAFDPRLRDPQYIELQAKLSQLIGAMRHMILDLDRRFNQFYIEGDLEEDE